RNEKKRRKAQGPPPGKKGEPPGWAGGRRRAPARMAVPKDRLNAAARSCPRPPCNPLWLCGCHATAGSAGVILLPHAVRGRLDPCLRGGLTPDALSPPPPAERPTPVRWLVGGLACATSWLLYLHCHSWGVIRPKIRARFGSFRFAPPVALPPRSV